MEIIKNLVDLESLFSSLAGAFCGAACAFWLNIVMLERSERRKNVGYLGYSISSLAGLVNSLYGIKRDFALPKCRELDEIRSKKNALRGVPGKHRIEVKELTSFMQYKAIHLPFVIEKLNFIVRVETNVISIMISLESNLYHLNKTIEDYNEYLISLRDSGSDKQPNMNLIESFARNLYEQVDSVLYLAEKTNMLLLECGRRLFKKSFKLISVEMDDKYRELKPKSIESWEQLKWFELKKRGFLARFFKIYGKQWGRF